MYTDKNKNYAYKCFANPETLLLGIFSSPYLCEEMKKSEKR